MICLQNGNVNERSEQEQEHKAGAASMSKEAVDQEPEAGAATRLLSSLRQIDL